MNLQKSANLLIVCHAFLHIHFGIVVLSIRLPLLLSCVWHQENRCDGLAYTIVTMLGNLLFEVTGGNALLMMLLILWGSAIFSSILDNIPFVATMIPLILSMQADGMDVTALWWALSLGACLGGNGTLIGASANVVLSGISAKHGHPITFMRYLKIGFPMMILSIVISTVYLLIRFA